MEWFDWIMLMVFVCALSSVTMKWINTCVEDTVKKRRITMNELKNIDLDLNRLMLEFLTQKRAGGILSDWVYLWKIKRENAIEEQEVINTELRTRKIQTIMSVGENFKSIQIDNQMKEELVREKRIANDTSEEVQKQEKTQTQISDMKLREMLGVTKTEDRE
ncbi:MAG: hypothetical protein C4581_06615 [Nitrospiraceae bacterium]|nr:MAG: hypothetical protein C4581_06615 [Nitrospiraceae bacterium]